MISLKKVFGNELMHFALLLTLLRVNPQYYFESDYFNIDTDSVYSNNGTSRSYYSPRNLIRHIHPKNYDSYLLNYERELFAELNSFGQYNPRQNQIEAYLLSIDRPAVLGDVDCSLATNDNPEPEQLQEVANRTLNETNSDGDLGLSQEDMDLIEVLWKQDVDLGFSIQHQELDLKNSEDDLEKKSTSSHHGDDDIEKLKALKVANQNIVKEEIEESSDSQSWNSLNYTIDTETGEYVIKEETQQPLSATDCEPSCSIPLGDLSLPLPEFLLDEALQLVELDDNISKTSDSNKSENNTDDIPFPSSVVQINSASPDTNVNSLDSVIEETNIENLTSDESTSKLIKDLQSDEDLNFFADMIQTTQFHPHHRAFQARMPFVRTMSMEQRWQDLASLLSLQNPNDTTAMPHHFSHHHHPLHNYSHPHSHTMGYNSDTRGVLLHNATLAPPMGDLNSTLPYSNIGGTNLGNAVATSMNLTNSSEPMAEPTSTPHYKLEPPTHDLMYYQNNSSELNHNDGFLSSILNDEDLQLMDMAMNEGMYTMRMLDSNNTINNVSMAAAASTTTSRSDIERLDASSDSAVSSMGSERVSSLSDGEWCDAGSDSGHPPGDHYVDYHISKYRPYDYSYTSNRQHGNALGNCDNTRTQPVAQKKHQMFGKRYFQEQSSISTVTQTPPTPIKYEYADSNTSFTNSDHLEPIVGAKPPDVKYSCGLEYSRSAQTSRNSITHIQHNHTYHLPVENASAMQRPLLRDKLKGHKSEEEHLTRDEKRARSLQVPISVDDIINLPMDEFNERLSKYDLSETQLSLIRDIRRRGKNKVAAQNCRKRKLDQILSLADEVKEIRDRKLRMLSEQDFILAERRRIKDKYQQLYRHVFQNLRDPDGNPYSPYQYSLQTSADGSILIVPRANNTMSNNAERNDPAHQN